MLQSGNQIAASLMWVTLVVELDLPKSQVALGAYSRPPNNAIVFDVLLYDNFVCRVSTLVLGSD
jgi:hypothetical protein